MGLSHPFSGRQGSYKRNQFAQQLFVEQLGQCAMCGTPLSPALTGKGKQASVVDHKKPWRLRPDLKYDKANLWLICWDCHGICNSIEQRHSGDAEAIAQAKEAHRPIGLDGYPV